MEKARKLTCLFYQIYQFYYSFSSTELFLVLHEQMHAVMTQAPCGENKT